MLSVILVSYNNLQNVKNCLESIFCFNDIGENLEVILIDNSTNNEIFNFVKDRYGNIIYIKNENKGFGQANNLGALLSTNQYILFLNTDTILIENIFEFAINSFMEDKDLTLFGVKLVNRNLKTVFSFGFLDRYGTLYSIALKICHKFNLFFKDIMFISGANIFIRKSTFIEIGMFDENIFLYYEESDLTRRLKNRKIKYFHNKKIIHDEGGSIDSESIHSISMRIKSYKYYCKKHQLNFNSYIESEIIKEKIKSWFQLMRITNKYVNSKNKINVFREFI